MNFSSERASSWILIHDDDDQQQQHHLDESTINIICSQSKRKNQNGHWLWFQVSLLQICYSWHISVHYNSQVLPMTDKVV